ncbi:MotA-like activator of middle period transcription [Salmonella phage vB_SnwM_CGG4-1]|uniref:Activator of middle period of transcription n=1 Tax=Salmonella phage vB_SnwM_CGG4-1 TaxID=1815631 RepID=A0A1B0VVJ6_9CAUD|nr:MotA-like activator of middle period transcription [Salmonella phage vB_SnwM_CGG4-1]ANA49602.1 activator of middle period of transcription [Salmonella phage vB_SnwM_CGG4-1]
MSKVTYIIKASNDVLNEKTASILVKVAKQDFITSAELREQLEDKMTASSVNSNIGVLIKKGLVEKSGDGLVITGEAQDIISNAAVLYAQENAPELLEKRNTRKARPITGDMEADKDFMMELLGTKEELFKIKKLDVYRSNFIAVLEKRTFGIRSFEVSNKGNFRISGYKMTEEQVKHFEDLGMTAKHSKNGNIYLDIARTQENIETIINSVDAL